MCQYNDYILQQMAKDRMDDARQKADMERWIIRQANQMSLREFVSREILMSMIQRLVSPLFGWQARAQRSSW